VAPNRDFKGTPVLFNVDTFTTDHKKKVIYMCVCVLCDLKRYLKVISGTLNGFVVCAVYKNTAQCTQSITTIGRHM